MRLWMFRVWITEKYLKLSALTGSGCILNGGKHMVSGRSLSEAEIGTIEHFRYYFDNKGCFALIDTYVIVGLSLTNAGNVKKLEQEALEKISQVLNYPPDFRTYVMDDQYGLVEMNYGVYGVSSEPLSDEEIASGKMSLGSALVVRSLCLEACESGKIIAIIDDV